MQTYILITEQKNKYIISLSWVPVVLTYTADMREQTFFHVFVTQELFPLEVYRIVL